MKIENLLPRQRAFITCYLKGMHAHQAAQCAGYAPSTAITQSARLLATPHIQQAIRLQLNQHQYIDDTLFGLKRLDNIYQQNPDPKIRKDAFMQIKAWLRIIVLANPGPGPLPLKLPRLQLAQHLQAQTLLDILRQNPALQGKSRHSTYPDAFLTNHQSGN